MDIKDNKYKKIVGGIIIDQNLGDILGQQIMQYDENAAIINSDKKRAKSIYNVIAIVVFAIFLALATLFITSSSFHPFTPKGVVKQYVYSVRNNDFDKAERYVNEDYDMNHDFLRLKELIYQSDFYEHRDGEDKTKSIVNLRVKYPGDEIGEFAFWLRKINGKWYITSREIIN